MHPFPAYKIRQAEEISFYYVPIFFLGFFFFAWPGILNIRQLSKFCGLVGRPDPDLWPHTPLTRPIFGGMHLRQTFRHLRIPQHFHFWLSYVHLTFCCPPKFSLLCWPEKVFASSRRHFI